MTDEIQKQEWKGFLDNASKNYSGWQTRVELLRDDIGAQILSENLPLMGVMFEEKAGGGEGAIEIMLGAEEAGAAHQTHTIFNPTKVAFLETNDAAGGTLEIEDAGGAKTLVEISAPGLLEMVYGEVEIMATVN